MRSRSAGIASFDYPQPIVEILTKAPVLHGLGQVDVRRCDQAEAGLDRVRAAHTLDLALLNRAKQLRLKLVAQVADLVQEQRPASGQLELSQLLSNGAREGPLLVAEERALHELLRNRRQVDGHEGRVRIARLAMDHPREQLLAGSALTENQHRGRQLRHLLHELDNFARGAAWPDDELAVVLLGHFGVQPDERSAQILPLARVGRERPQPFGVEVLGDVVIRPVPHRLDCGVELLDRGGDDDLDVRDSSP